MTVPQINYSRKNPPPAKKRNENNKTPLSSTTSNGLLGSLIDGVTFGAGSSIGHGIVNKFSSYFQSDKKESCSEILKKFEECKNSYNTNVDICEKILVEYEQCQKL
jgi:hypothetical protein